MSKLPNFLIVGAAKSGTSSLHNYLNQHPDIFMPSFNEKGMKVKEPRFLIKDIVKNRLHNGVWSWEEYQSLFNKVNNETLIGESTVLYLYYYKEAIKNIKSRLGENVKIIIMLRDPVDRAFSAYTHVARSVKENLSFEEALSIESNRLEKDKTLTPMVMYKDMGLYFDMVKAYKENFKDVHIIFYNDFKDNTHEVVNKTLTFLGVKSKVNLDTQSKHNVGGKSWKNSTIKYFFMRDNLIKKMFRNIFSKKIRKFFREIVELFLKQKAVPMKDKTREELREFFFLDIEKLERLLDVDLKHWKE